MVTPKYDLFDDSGSNLLNSCNNYLQIILKIFALISLAFGKCVGEYLSVQRSMGIMLVLCSFFTTEMIGCVG
jgi:hypothetical protein